MERMARMPSTAREFQDTASPAVVSLYSVVPALIATKDGGATPVSRGKHKRVRNNQSHQKENEIESTKDVTEEGSDKEHPQRHIDDRRGDVNEPVW